MYECIREHAEDNETKWCFDMFGKGSSFLQFLPLTPGPGKLLRASTKKVGTDTYRAPEIDSGTDYDPSAADIWSLGVTLFFMVSLKGLTTLVVTMDTRNSVTDPQHNH